VKPLHIFNTLSRTVEEFSPAEPPIVTFYSCGPTVYLPQHLGNMRAYVFVDTLTRVLEYNGYDVRHVMNITDVGHLTSDEDEGEDKIEKTARAEGKQPIEIANHYLRLFHDDCAKLNIEPPTVECRATDHILEMIALIERIIERVMAT
jgi:cysteinyl-tRNA synthetase